MHELNYLEALDEGFEVLSLTTVDNGGSDSRVASTIWEYKICWDASRRVHLRKITVAFAEGVKILAEADCAFCLKTEKNYGTQSLKEK